MTRIGRTPTERFVGLMRVRAVLGYAALVAPFGAVAWVICHSNPLPPYWLTTVACAAIAVPLQFLAYAVAGHWPLAKLAIAALNDASPDAALYSFYTTRRTSRLALQDAAVDRAIATHLDHLAAGDAASAEPVVRDAIEEELARGRTALGRARRRTQDPPCVLAHIHAAAAIGGQRYVQPLADLAAMQPRNAAEEEVRAAAVEALRTVQARLREANDHLLRPADAPGETLLRAAEPAREEALLRAAGEATEVQVQQRDRGR